jgi:hypothetical protein
MKVRSADGSCTPLELTGQEESPLSTKARFLKFKPPPLYCALSRRLTCRRIGVAPEKSIKLVVNSFVRKGRVAAASIELMS